MSKINLLRKFQDHIPDNSIRGKSVKRVPTRSHNTFNVSLEAITDKQRLVYFQKQELKFYNELIEGFTSRVRVNPDSVTAMHGDWETLFGQVAFNRLDMHQIWLSSYSKTFELPEVLKPFKNLLLKNEKLAISEGQALLLGIAGRPGQLHPQVRQAMALEALAYFKKQADTRMMDSATRSYNISPKGNSEFLEKLEEFQKRHVQLPRKLVKVEYNGETESTVLKTPYTEGGIVVENINLNDDTVHWNYLIIRQEADRIPSANSPWQVDLRQIPNHYLLKCYDARHSHNGSAFHTAKARR